jgi:hypothetical protein
MPVFCNDFPRNSAYFPLGGNPEKKGRINTQIPLTSGENMDKIGKVCEKEGIRYGKSGNPEGQSCGTFARRRFFGALSGHGPGI